jgi:hypothetical protein
MSQRIVQVCLFLVSAIAVLGGSLQMYLGQPDTILPPPSAVWLGYLIPELLLPVVIAVAHAATHRHASRAATAA